MWKSRAYSFLFRRILGPFLTPQSQESLHQSLTVSLRGGNFELLYVEFDGKAIASKLGSEFEKQVKIEKVLVKRMAVSLSLIYVNSDGKVVKEYEDGSARLVASVELDGVDVLLKPISAKDRDEYENSRHREQREGEEGAVTNASQSGSGANTGTKYPGRMTSLRSYIQAAMDNLKLFLKINDINIKIASEDDVAWISLNVANISYQDEKNCNPCKTSGVDKRERSIKILKKDLSVDTITLTVGSETERVREEVVRSEGLSTLRVTDEFRDKEGSGRREMQKLARSRSLEFIIEPEIVFHACVDTLQRINRLVIDFSGPKEPSNIEPCCGNIVQDDGQEGKIESESQHTGSVEDEDLDDIAVGTGEYTNGLLANIIQAQGNEHYMDKLNKKKKENDTAKVKREETAQTEGRSGGASIDDLESDIGDFFDSNDEDFSHYRSTLESSITSIDIESSTDVTSTTLHLTLKKMAINLHLSDDKYAAPRDTVLLTMECLELSSKKMDLQQSIAMHLSRFHIDHVIHDTVEGGDSDEASSLFVMIGNENNQFSGEATISSGSVLSIAVDKTEDGDSPPQTNVSILLNPFQVTFRHSVLSRMIKSLTSIRKQDSAPEGGNSSNSISSRPRINMNCSLTCSSFSVLIPLEIEDKFSTEERLDDIFRRSGYDSDWLGELREPTLCLETRRFSLQIVQDMNKKEEFATEDLHIAASIHRSVISFVSPRNRIDRQSLNAPKLDFPVRRLDIVALESEEKIDPDAVIKLEMAKSCLVDYNEGDKKKRAKHYYPLVTPLASVKASQQYDDIKLEAKDDSRIASALKRGKKRLRGSDPQIAMLRNLNDCEKIIHVHIPSAAVDLSILEMNSFRDVLNSVSIPDASSTTVDEKKDNAGPSPEASLLGVNFQCDQFTISTHQECNNDGTSLQFFNHMIIFDGLKSHFLVHEGSLKHSRVLAEDLTLYESEETCPVSLRNKSVKTIAKMCEQIRIRRSERNMKTSAKFFRSKMSNPLSPKTPAVLIDIIIQRNEFHTEKALHFSIYDMTFRYEYQSTWIDRLMNVFNRPGQVDAASKKDASPGEESINNLFVTFSDCNLDYTAPTNFTTECRTIVHVGELRLTSNLVLPAGPIRVMKITLADASAHVTNRRVTHDFENGRLSCSKLVFKNLDQRISRGGPLLNSNCFEDALSRMDFVRVVTLDCLDSTVSLNSATSIIKKDAGCSVKVSIGRTCIYACKDSFLCFTESTNELINNLTMPSKVELEKMWNEFMSKQAQHSQNDANERGQNEEATITSQDSESIRTTASLVEIIDHDLFASHILDEDNEQFTGDRDVIDDFFTVGRRKAKARNRTYCSSPRAQSLLHNIDSWTTVHHAWENDHSIAEGEEQSARWYSEEEIYTDESCSKLILPRHTKVIIDGGIGERRPHVFDSHIPIDPVTNPLDPSLNDMGAAKYAGAKVSLKVKLRLMVEDMSLHCRFFDGRDWDNSGPKKAPDDNAIGLMNALVGDSNEDTDLFSKPKQKPLKQLRRSQRYFQFSFTGIKLRLDSFENSPDHSLSSCLDLTLNDLSFLETISGSAPVKLLGEWRSDEHLRDANDGLLMMKMVSMHPDEKFSSDGKLMGDEGRVTMEFLPLRFFIHQVALRFIRGFFRHEEVGISKESSVAAPPEIFFPVFQVKPFNIKVDYKPKHVNTSALKDGSLVELLNVLPLEDMILRLSEVEMRNLTGWGSIISELACNWLQDISSTQMHKFLTRTTPLQPFATVGDGMKQFLMIPLEEYQQKGDVKKGLRKGTKKLANVLAYETLGVGAKVSGFVAKKLGKKKSKRRVETDHHLLSLGSSLPRSMNEVSDHAIESLTRGLKEANAKMIIIPYRQYQESGTRGAMKSVVKGLPVAVCAPLSGAAEAVSYGLYGVRNQLRPDLREEEEASNRLHEFHF